MCCLPQKWILRFSFSDCCHQNGLIECIKMIYYNVQHEILLKTPRTHQYFGWFTKKLTIHISIPQRNWIEISRSQIQSTKKILFLHIVHIVYICVYLFLFIFLNQWKSSYNWIRNLLPYVRVTLNVSPVLANEKEKDLKFINVVIIKMDIIFHLSFVCLKLCVCVYFA